MAEQQPDEEENAAELKLGSGACLGAEAVLSRLCWAELTELWAAQCLTMREPSPTQKPRR